MGLDNGFLIKGLTRKEIPSFVMLPFEKDFYNKGEIELAYWRKCWGIRNMILSVLHAPQDKYDFQVDPEDLDVIIRKMQKFFDRKYWEEEGDSIWEFDEAFEFTLLQQTINLKWFLEYWRSHPKLELRFYDSY